MYDKTMCVSTSAATEARELMTKALKAPLTLQQQQHLLAELGNDPKLVYHIGLTPCKVSKLNFVLTTCDEKIVKKMLLLVTRFG